MFIAHQAFAQAGPTAPGDAPSMLGEVIVTAQKRAERLQDVPVAITAISGDSLSRAGVTEIRQLYTLAPGVRIDGTGTYIQPTIRGIGTTSANSETNVAIYRDGFYQPSQVGNNIELNTIEQVQVLKGPQGTLFGRNATGGAILITTTDPSFSSSGHAAVSYGSFNDLKANLYGNAALSDTFAANLSLNVHTGDGWVKNIVTGQHDGDVHTYVARGKLLFKPTDRLDITLTLEHSDLAVPFGATYSSYQGNSVGNLLGGVVASRPNRTSENARSKTDTMIDAVYLRGRADLGRATLSSYTGYLREKDSIVADLDFSSKTAFEAIYTNKLRAFSQEFNLTSQDEGPLKWVLGLYYFNSRADVPSFVVRTPTFTLVRPVTASDTDAYAAFADATYQLAPKLFLTGGLRYSYEKKSYVAKSPASFIEDTKSWDAFTPRLAVRYEWTPNQSSYASFSQGFKSGAFNADGTPAVNPEKVRAYEIGYKAVQSEFNLATSAFYYDYKDLQFTSYSLTGASSVSTLQNAAKARIYGADVDASVAVSKALSVRLGVAYLHARYDSFPGAVGYRANVVVIGGRPILVGNTAARVDASGNSMLRSPDWTASAGFTYEAGLANGTLQVSGSVYATSRVYFDPTERLSQSPYASLDLRASWISPAERWKATVFGANLTDSRYAVNLFPVTTGTGANYAAPATFGAGLEFRF